MVSNLIKVCFDENGLKSVRPCENRQRKDRFMVSNLMSPVCFDHFESGAKDHKILLNEHAKFELPLRPGQSIQPCYN